MLRNWSGSLLAVLILFFGTGLHHAVDSSADRTEVLDQHSGNADYFIWHFNLPGCPDDRISSGSGAGKFHKPVCNSSGLSFISERIQSRNVSGWISVSKDFLLSCDIRTVIYPFHFFW